MSSYDLPPLPTERRKPRLVHILVVGVVVAILAGLGLMLARYLPHTPSVSAPTSDLPVTQSQRAAAMASSTPTPVVTIPPPTSTPTPPPSFTPSPFPVASPSPSATFVPTQVPSGVGPDVPALARLMRDLINADRAAENLDPVAWDDLAADVAQAHAEAMAEDIYMSHWNLVGEGPDVRYGRAGGTETVQENVYMYWYRYEDGRPAPIEDWEAVIREAQVSLMNSPGHRANIMAPAHTHVGIGIAYNAEAGEVRIAQEFINRYVAIVDPIPAQAPVGAVVTVKGQLLGEVERPVINLAYEPFPTPMSVMEAESVHVYQSPAEFFEAIEPSVDAEGVFSADVRLDSEGRPGLYHIRIWVHKNDVSIHASDIIVDMTK